MKRHLKITAARALLLVMACSAVITAQDGGIVPAPSAQKEGRPKEVKVVIPSLKGLVFLSPPAGLQADVAGNTGVDTAAVEMLNRDDFKEMAGKFIGRPVTMDDLHAITHRVVLYYRAHNHPLVEAIVPSQNVQSGVIQVVVTEYKVGSVRPEGNRWFSDDVVTAPFSLQHGDTVDSDRLVNELESANMNPFRRVNVIYQPSTEPGYTDVVLETQDQLPVRVFTGFDNGGTPVTGRNRWELGATWGNALWHDQQITYQLSTSTNFFDSPGRRPGVPGGASFVGQSLNWSIPVRGRDSVVVSGNYERSVPAIGEDFGLLGKSWGVSARYNLALHRTNSFTHTVSLGYDFKSTNNNLAFGGTQVMRNSTQIDQFTAGYAANLTDRWGSTSLSTSLFFSPGNITPDNTNAQFQPAFGQSGRDLASAHYTYWRTDLNRLTRLPWRSVHAFRLLGQTSTSNLLYTEQLAGGGQEIMRGYDPNALLGDRGIIMSNELRSPVFGGGHEVSFGGIQAVAFWDFAHLGSVQNVADFVNHLNGSSVGVGLRYALRSNLSAKSDYGWQLQHLPEANSRDHLVSFGLILSY